MDQPATGCPFSGGSTGPGRRAFLIGMAGVAAAPAIQAALPTSAAAGATLAPAEVNIVTPPMGPVHGTGMPRGADVAVRLGRPKQGRYGLMFPSLPAYSAPDAALLALGEAMVERKSPLPDVAISNDGKDIPNIPAGYIYFGQFIDHDMTHDTTPLELALADPMGMVNFDSPSFDLGSMYGEGPEKNPELYDPDQPGRLLLDGQHGIWDLPRNADGSAIIGDGRNDENLIVAHLHVGMMRFHNRFIDEGYTFGQAQRIVRHHYQWLIVNDFLKRWCGESVVSRRMRATTGGWTSLGRFYKPINTEHPMIPLEFSAAAYRFGHSGIRAEYEIHNGTTVPIFGYEGFDLRGNRPFPAHLDLDWNYFFEIPGMRKPNDRNYSRYIDTQLSLPLRTLPPTVVAPTDGAIISLAQRNLLRGQRLGLPSGQAVAKAMGLRPLSNRQLGLKDARFNGESPLWYYVLKEAELYGGRRLGPVGGTIVAETILGIMAADPYSYFNTNRRFTPIVPRFSMGALLVLAGETH